MNLIISIQIPASMLEHAPLETVQIYFDTATYDEIERDEKVTSLTLSLMDIKYAHWINVQLVLTWSLNQDAMENATS